MGRLGRVLFPVVVVAVLIVMIAIPWRTNLVQAGLSMVMSAQGYAGATFHVAKAGWSETVVQDVDFGAGGPTIRRVLLDYTVDGLMGRRIDAVRVEGLRGRLSALIGMVGDGGAGPDAEIPPVRIDDAVIALDGPVTGDLRLSGDLTPADGRLAADLDVGVDLGHTTATAAVRSDDLRAGGTVEIDGLGETDLAALAGALSPGVAVAGGHAKFTAAGAVRLPETEPTLGPGGTAPTLSGEFTLTGPASAAGMTIAAADIGWALSGDGRTLSLELTRPATLAVTGVADALAGVSPLGGPAGDVTLRLQPTEPVATWRPRRHGGELKLAAEASAEMGRASALLRGTASLRLDGDMEPVSVAQIAGRAVAERLRAAFDAGSAEVDKLEWTVNGTLSPAGDIALSGPLSASLRDVSGGGLAAAEGRIDGQASLTAEAGGWTLAAAPGLSMKLSGVTAPGGAALDGPASLTAETFEMSGGAGATRITLAAALAPVAGRGPGGDGGVAFEDAAGTIHLALTPEARLRLTGARARLPGPGLALSGMTVEAGPPDGGTTPVTLRGDLADAGAPARFAPLRLTLSGAVDGDALALDGALEAPGPGVTFPVSATADLAAGSATARAAPTRIAFARRGRQPSALARELAAIEDADGPVTVAASAMLAPGGGVETAVDLDFGGLSARSGDLEVEGLSGTLRLSPVAPLATPGYQTLTARRVVAGAPVDAATATFAIRPGRGGPSVRIKRFAGALAGGEVAVEDAVWTPGAKANDLVVQVREVDLGELLREWLIAGVSGTGRVSGAIPLSVGPAGVSVLDGHMAAKGGGVVRVDWGSARDTLVGSGDQVKLAVTALEDFHYDSLSVGVNQPGDGPLTLSIALEGANPDVLDGHPFRFNINLEGRLGPILDAVREGRRIGGDLIKGSLGGQ